MKIPSLLSFTFCLLLCSTPAHAMDPDEIVDHVYDHTITYSPGPFIHSREKLSTPSHPPQALYTPQKVLVYDKAPEEFKREKVLKKAALDKDGRSRVRPTKSWPHSICTQLSITFKGHVYGGSGAFAGPQHIVTCGHNVYDYDEKAWAKSIVAYPALDEAHAPFGKVKVARVYTFKGWVTQGHEHLDMAILVLSKPIGKYTGWAGLLSLDDMTLAQEKVNITGYPGDKGFNQMWTMAHMLKAIKPEQFYYEIDTAGGQSGSPIWINTYESPMILGVHTTGSNSINSGVRISGKKFTNFLVKLISDTYILDTGGSVSLPTTTLQSSLSLSPLSSSTPPSSPTISNRHAKVATSLPDSNNDKIIDLKHFDLAVQFEEEGNHDLANHHYNLAFSGSQQDNKDFRSRSNKSFVPNPSVDLRNADAQFRLGVIYLNGQGIPQSDTKAVARFRKAAHQGHAAAQFRLGGMYYEGRGVPQDDTEAVTWYRKAAHQGLADAQNGLGMMYYNGRGVPQSDTEAVTWYRKAAEQSNANAQYNLGGMYCDGQGVTQSDTEAVTWFRKAASQGLAEAQFTLGVMYQDGRGVSQDYKWAKELYYKAAKQGHAGAQFRLGGMYEHGQGMKQSYTDAVGWYSKAAEQGCAEAQFCLGDMYYVGRGVTQSDTDAVDWYSKAAKQGHAGAQSNLGWMYYGGRGVPQNDTEAVTWYRKAANQGLAEAQSNLGEMYYNGRGVPQDDTEAVTWYRKAADQGLAEARFNFGWMYYNGRGVLKNKSRAAEWFDKAADQGYVEAQFRLGWMYENGEGVSQDYKLAKELYSKAAKQGHAGAQFRLGRMYENGEGMEESNDTEAVTWYKEAANQGWAEAQFSLGDMYLTGRGVEQSHTEAVNWYSKAAEQGHPEAQKVLDEIQ